MMFDMMQRCILDKKANMVKYVKNQNSEPLDKEVKVGKPMDEKWLKAHTTIFHSLVGTPFRSDAEYVEYVQRVHSLRTKYGYMPEE
jgi:methyl-coenzyme M reductase gamma subunit